MKIETSTLTLPILASALCIALAAGEQDASAHCDGMDGPVVVAAQQALADGNVSPALVWVKKEHEPEVKAAFEKASAVRKLTTDARELADKYFFETVVRLHRVGEGAPYTGLKPAGRDFGAAITAAEKALRSGDIKPLRGMISEEVGRGLQYRFQEAAKRAKFDKNDIAAGRAYVAAYTEFIHYVEGMHSAAAHHTPGHGMDVHGVSTSTPTPEITAAAVPRAPSNVRIK
jgi:hypothetical protein